MNRIVNLAIIGFIALACDSYADSRAYDAVTGNDIAKPPSLNGWDTVLTEQGVTSGKYLLRDGVLVFHPLGENGVLSTNPIKVVDERFFSVPAYAQFAGFADLAAAPKAPTLNPVGLPKTPIDPQLANLVMQQTQLISTLSSSILELQRTVEEMRAASEDETAQLKKQLVLTDTRLKILETKTGGN